MNSKRPGFRWMPIVVIGVAIVTAIVFAGTAAGVNPAPSGRTFVTPSILGRGAQPSDSVSISARLSDVGDVGDGGIDPTSVRYVGTDTNGRYWVARDNSANVCVLAEMWGESLSSACVSPPDFAARGIAFNLAGSSADQYSEVYMIPDDIDAKAVSSQTGLHVVSSNVLTGDSRGSSQTQFTFAGDAHLGRTPFDFHLLPPPEPADPLPLPPT